jgi:lysophospholipase L1-like esterase
VGRREIRRALRIPALILGSVAFVLVAAEIGVRISGALSPPAPTGSAPPDPELASLPRLVGVLELARPDVRGVFEGVLHRTNSAGMRGPEVARSPAPGTFRIAVAGDSVTMGQGVPEERSYPALLEQSLARASEGTRYEVLNLGLAGLAIRNVIRRLERVGLPYSPQLVVYGFTLNDIEGPAYRPNPPEEQQDFARRLLRFDSSPLQLVRLLWPRFVSLRSALWPLPGSYEFALERNYFHVPQAWEQVGAGLDRLAQIAAARGICAVVFIHASMHQLRGPHPFGRIYRRVEEAARERGLYVVQSLPLLRGHDAAALRFSVVDPHPNAAGHELLARALAAGLEELPDACGPVR